MGTKVTNCAGGLHHNSTVSVSLLVQYQVIVLCLFLGVLSNYDKPFTCQNSSASENVKKCPILTSKGKICGFLASQAITMFTTFYFSRKMKKNSE